VVDDSLDPPEGLRGTGRDKYDQRRDAAAKAYDASYFVNNRCEYCFIHGSSKVIDSRWDSTFEGVRRRRECCHCKFRWSTLELDLDQVQNLLGMELSNEEEP